MIKAPPIHRQRYEIHEYCKLWTLEFELHHVEVPADEGRWFWAIVRPSSGEPVWLGKDEGYFSRGAAVHAAWKRIWPGRQVRAA